MQIKDIARIQERIEQGEGIISLGGLHGPAKGFVLSQLYRQLNRSFLILSPRQETGETLFNDLEFFATEKGRATGRSSLLFFPSWGTLPYEPIAPHRDLVSERFKVLDALMSQHPLLVVTSVEALLQKLVPRKIVAESILTLETSAFLEREALVNLLVQSGYAQRDLVEDRGEFSVRGGIVDIFPPLFPHPLRVELFGDQIDSIRAFDVETQKSIKIIESVKIFPAREILLNRERRLQGIDALQKQMAEMPGERRKWEILIDHLSQIDYLPGFEYLAPWLYPSMETLFDYLPSDTILLIDEPDEVNSRRRELIRVARKEYEKTRERGEIFPEPEAFYLSREEYEFYLPYLQRIELDSLKRSLRNEEEGLAIQSQLTEAFSGRFEDCLKQIKEWLRNGFSVGLVARSGAHAERVKRLLLDFELSAQIFPTYAELLTKGSRDGKAPNLAICLGKLSHGFELPQERFAFLTDEEIFGRQRPETRARRSAKKSRFLGDLSSLRPHDLVVHIDYGIGRYLGLMELEVGEGKGEFVVIEYADGEKLYVPMDGIYAVQKYLGSGEEKPQIDRLGGGAWSRVKKRVKESIKEMAIELLKLYAEREVVEGFAFSLDTEWHQEFDASFEFEETPDQLQAIEDVKGDMEELRPMDRLVCGDVGYGKTEVAIRAAFKAVLDRKQVAVLVPTTILAQQHTKTFTDRFAPHAIRVEMLSRFRTPAEQKRIISDLKAGKIDIIIGTHRLLQKDIAFYDLGLVVIDEEHRFGVAHKEKLKQLRKTVDVLTLTATPIPRTLHFSLMGIRDLSVIDTPPADRLSIKTYFKRFSKTIIREAIRNEMARGGQVFFVHNRVESIEAMGRLIKNVVPEARICIAHGQMFEKELELRMVKFINKEYDVLLCTTIIESGLDIPAVNTIIINRADKFGLAQLYQLRGRVGRSREQAYAYLLIPGEELLSDEARDRLMAIAELSELGSGFKLAARDMEIRGVGNILGPQQSGQIASVGFDLYAQLMEETIAELKGEKVEERFEPKVAIDLEGGIPREYMANPNQRLEIYRRLFDLRRVEELEELKEELKDRYGMPPEALATLFDVVEIRIFARLLRLEKVEKRGQRLSLTFTHGGPVTPGMILRFLKEGRKRPMAFASQETLVIELEDNRCETVLSYLRKLEKIVQEEGNQ
ncbi:MAG: transcription-repair coupling factor [Candidatus Tectomicrobia bacterium]|nr:transcription-repair coupling factor [Candidatus Tectomicrobia bacterium]